MKTSKFLSAVMLFVALSFGLVSCEPSEPATSNKVKTGKATEITQNSALLQGEVDIDISAYSSVKFGVMIATTKAEINARMGDAHDADVLIGKDFEVQLNGLSADTKYYYCAWLFLNNMQYEFGEIKTFETLSANDSNTGNGGSSSSTAVPPTCTDYVDLGLSVKWATCNVGASSPEEYGSYFAWGETTPQTDYYWSTYKWCNGSYDTMTKYCTDSDYGTVDNKTVLDKEDDAASVNMGGSWRMPTYDELNELKTKCTWTWTSNYNGTGVAGRIVTSKTNGNSIFLPAAGYRYDSGLSGAGSGGYYWSSSLGTDRSSSAYYLFFFGSDIVDWNYYDRYYGRSVRGVCE